MNKNDNRIKTRRNETPNRKDVLFIMKHINNTPFQHICKELKVNEKTLLQWYKMIFDIDERERRYRAIEQNLDEMEMLESFDESLQSEYDIHNIKRIGQSTYYVVKKRVVNELRAYYMVTLNANYTYLVRFDTPVNRHSITYSNEAMGCDYEVHSMSSWEYYQLDKHLPVITINGDDGYVANFWMSMCEMLYKYA